MELWKNHRAYIPMRFVCSGVVTMSTHEQVPLSAAHPSTLEQVLSVFKLVLSREPA
jgi:hypothetical protein